MRIRLNKQGEYWVYTRGPYVWLARKITTNKFTCECRKRQYLGDRGNLIKRNERMSLKQLRVSIARDIDAKRIKHEHKYPQYVL